jgi:hypothetical protein
VLHSLTHALDFCYCTPVHEMLNSGTAVNVCLEVFLPWFFLIKAWTLLCLKIAYEIKIKFSYQAKRKINSLRITEIDTQDIVPGRLPRLLFTGSKQNWHESATTRSCANYFFYRWQWIDDRYTWVFHLWTYYAGCFSRETLQDFWKMLACHKSSSQDRRKQAWRDMVCFW